MNWKTPITLLVLLLLLGGAAYYGWHAVATPTVSTGTLTSPTQGEPTCLKHKHVTKGQRIVAKDIAVNVYNAGSVPGLAAATSGRLSDNGFQAGLIADAPAHVAAKNVTILSDTGRSPEVRLVAKQFNGPVVVRKKDLGAGVDVVLGDKFQSVDSHAKPYLVVHKTLRTCVTASTATP